MNYYYAKINEGQIVGVQVRHEPFQEPPPGWLQVPEGVGETTHYVVDGKLFPYPPEARERLLAGPPCGKCKWSVAALNWVDLRNLAETKEEKLREINKAFSAAAARLTAGYPTEETLTWGIQQTEALAWQADPDAPTPYLDGLAASRGIDPVEMRQRTLNKVLAFMAASQSLVGTRQRLEDAVNNATTVEEVDALSWPLDD